MERRQNEIAQDLPITLKDMSDLEEVAPLREKQLCLNGRKASDGFEFPVKSLKSKKFSSDEIGTLRSSEG